MMLHAPLALLVALFAYTLATAAPDGAAMPLAVVETAPALTFAALR